jgi:hypothetical protein
MMSPWRSSGAPRWWSRRLFAVRDTERMKTRRQVELAIRVAD